MTAEKKSALQTIEEKRDLITGIADKIWEFAELSLQEFKSAAAYCEALEKEGFEVRCFEDGESILHLRHPTDMVVRISAFWQSMMHFPDFHRKQG